MVKYRFKITFISIFTLAGLVFISLTYLSDKDNNTIQNKSQTSFDEIPEHKELEIYLNELIKIVNNESYKSINIKYKKDRKYSLIMAVRPDICSLCLSEINEYVDIIDSAKTIDINPVIVLIGSNLNYEKEWLAQRIKIDAEIIYQVPSVLSSNDLPEYLLLINNDNNKIHFTKRLISSQITSKISKLKILNTKIHEVN